MLLICVKLYVFNVIKYMICEILKKKYIEGVFLRYISDPTHVIQFQKFVQKIKIDVNYHK